MKHAYAAFMLLLLGASSSAEAHRFEAPDTITARPGGAFRYYWVLTAVADTAVAGGYGWSGITNTPPGVMSEGRCLYTVLPGQQIRFEVSGSLSNPARPGRIQNWIDNCHGWTHENFTEILPFSGAIRGTHSAVSVPGGSAPVALRFAVIGAQPVGDAVRFSFDLPEAASATIDVFDAAGRRVAGVGTQAWPAGTHEASLDARSLPTGVYKARLTAGGRQGLVKLVRVR